MSVGVDVIVDSRKRASHDPADIFLGHSMQIRQDRLISFVHSQVFVCFDGCFNRLNFRRILILLKGGGGSFTCRTSLAHGLNFTIYDVALTVQKFIPTDYCRIYSSFVGLVFGAKDEANFELVYVSADNEWELPNLQYDPVINGSSTWQIYHGPRYQALVPVPSDQWVKLTLKVQPSNVAIYVGGALEPNLVIPNTMHGRQELGNIGVWGSSEAYMRNLTVSEIETESFFEDDLHVIQRDDAFVSEWVVCKQPDRNWIKVGVKKTEH